MTNQGLVNSVIKKFGPNGGYKDLGLVIDATNMAAGAIVTSSWNTGVEWVRSMVCQTCCDQQHEVGCYRGDAEIQTAAYSTTIGTALAATTNVYYRATSISLALGYAVKFSLKNTAASSNTFGRLRVQLLGL